MDRQTELAIVRRAYAKQIMAAAQVSDPRIEAAYAEIRREDFLGPGPWPMIRILGGYVTTPDDDPVLLYVDQLVGIAPERRLNNGQPSLHAALLKASDIQEGEHVVHVGAGTGYFTALMSYLAGPTGKVTAVEFDPGIAARAREYLAPRANVTVLEGNGAAMSFDSADVIYINAGVTHPADNWLDSLSEGGRLILPLTSDLNFRAGKPGVFDPVKAMNSGAYFRIQRHGAELEARGLMLTAIIPADRARDTETETALAAAFEKGGWNRVKRLVRGEVVPAERCWVRGRGWCFTYD
jgi:protein-L-isoaspartate(D-aspartate) O-methyltransferase